MGAKTPPKTVQKHPKRFCFSTFLLVFGAKCPQVRPRTPKTAKFGAKRAPKTPPRPPLDLDFNTILTISYKILKDFSSSFASICSPLLCFALRCFTGSTTNNPHYQDNASTRQPHLRNNVSLPARWRVMRSTWDIIYIIYNR